ncbi:MAG: 1,4-alpha-glucan branching enzyme, partial [Burkholderiales bacterium]
MLTEQDAYLFREGTHARLYERLGCHFDTKRKGAQFGVWAPNARSVSVIGDWNGWRAGADKLAPRGDHSGIWEGEVRGVERGQAYKFRIES